MVGLQSQSKESGGNKATEINKISNIKGLCPVLRYLAFYPEGREEDNREVEGKEQ